MRCFSSAHMPTMLITGMRGRKTHISAKQERLPRVQSRDCSAGWHKGDPVLFLLARKFAENECAHRNDFGCESRSTTHRLTGLAFTVASSLPVRCFHWQFLRLHFTVPARSATPWHLPAVVSYSCSDLCVSNQVGALVLPGLFCLSLT